MAGWRGHDGEGEAAGARGQEGVWAGKQDCPRGRPDAESEPLGKESEQGGRYSERDSEMTKITLLLDIDFSFFCFLFFYRSQQV